MSSEIEFGELEEAQPQLALRPDEDAHFATAIVGDLSDDELLIYVDLDVMRDMEAHASSNTRVELGGVMLGRQHVDAKGRPFVVITDCLRAENYEATKSSFTFTHETWSEITRRRREFHPELEMVGWYHTHPGWSVFLSGMDLFICNHFFNRPLDVALVIDPCQQDRGWFQWTEPQQTMRTQGFILTTSRWRTGELDYFSKLYNREPAMSVDPRYSNSIAAGTAAGPGLQPKSNVFELAVVGLLAMQFFLLALLAWNWLTPTTPPPDTESAQLVALQKQFDELRVGQIQSAREETFREILGLLAQSQGSEASLVSEFETLKSDKRQLQANIDGQLARNEKLARQRDEFAEQSSAAEQQSQLLTTKLAAAEQRLQDRETELNAAMAKLADLNLDLPIAETTASDSSLQVESASPPTLVQQLFSVPWWIWTSLGLLFTGIGGAAGFLFARQQSALPHDRQVNPRGSDPRSFAGEAVDPDFQFDQREQVEFGASTGLSNETDLVETEAAAAAETATKSTEAPQP